MNTPSTVISIKQLCETHGYPDPKRTADEASKAGILLDIAGIPHIYLEEWTKYIQKVAASQRSARSKSKKSLADTDQLGIVNSNLKRLPESIRSKERKLRSVKALLESVPSSAEDYSLRGEKNKLEAELKIHKENLKKAQGRQKQLLAQRAAELDALEAEDKEPDDSTSTKKEVPAAKSSK
ncbi:MAG: hypothetical protein GY839_19375 [candidate division Zixibacteria bacterium]|nr:hypothetical protein [candidate division Zixibacteria bacterium]